MGDTRDFADAVVADRYALERELGQGGMASVWLARDLRHDRLVALKIIRRELAGSMGIDRFLREVRLTARLQHPGIVPLLDSGVLQASDGTPLPWYAMAYLEGEPLRDRLLRERQLPLADALRITEAVAAALLAAHRQGIVHRDIKPENIFLTDDHVFVVDFGIAKAMMDTGGERLTSSGLTIGTPAYMSPEQATGDAVDARTDQYSLATVLYEMLSGDVPFTGSTAQALLARRLTEKARPLRAVRPSVTEEVECAVLNALDRVPADRYPNIEAFVTALRRKGTPRGSMRRRTLLTAAAAAIVLVVAAVLALKGGSPRGRARAVTRDAAVVSLHRRGMQSLAKRTEEGTRDALASFNAALERDSSYGSAWAGLAQTYQQAVNRRFVFPGSARDSVLRLAVAALDRAIGLDGPDAEVLYTQAIVARMVDPTNLAPAVRALRQAASLDSRSARIAHRLAISLFDVGEREEAMRSWHRAVGIDPSYTEALAFLALGYMWNRQYDSAAVWADSAVLLDPNYLLARQAQGNIEVERGQFRRAAGAFEAALRLSSDVEIPNALAGSALVAARAGDTVAAARLLAQVESLMVPFTPVPSHNAVYNAAAYAALGKPVRAVEWLETYSPREDQHFQMHLSCDPALDPIAEDQRFRALLVAQRPEPSRGC